MVDNYDNQSTTNVIFIPYSRTFAGRAADALAYFPGYTVVAMVLDGEEPPEQDYIIVRKDGSFYTPVLPGTAQKDNVVVVNGGPTPLAVAAVRLAQHLNCPAYDVQRDGVIRLAV